MQADAGFLRQFPEAKQRDNDKHREADSPGNDLVIVEGAVKHQ